MFEFDYDLNLSSIALIPFVIGIIIIIFILTRIYLVVGIDVVFTIINESVKKIQRQNFYEKLRKDL